MKHCHPVGAWFAALLSALTLAPRLAAAAGGDAGHEFILAMSARDEAGFEHNAAIAQQLGATHVVITNDLPPATWEFDVPGDPYPAWYFRQPSILKIFPPAEVAPFVNADYASRLSSLLEERCRVLRRHGLKGEWRSNEPQVLPEAFFAAYPELRGPRVDQPNRSRAPRFAPCTDQPETLRLYREAIQTLLRRCPEIEIFDFLTTDSGSGFCWAPGLYPGANGPDDCRNRPMPERVSAFMTNFQDAGAAVGHRLEINLHQIEPRPWMIPSFSDPRLIAHSLRQGLAIDNLEGPDGRPFAATEGSSSWWGPFYPLIGIPLPSLSGSGFGARRQIVSFGDPSLEEFNLGLFRVMAKGRPSTELERQQALRQYAVQLAGETEADNLVALWQAVAEAKRHLDALDFGPMLTMGPVLTRWINRPMVPFPEELKPGETSYYRPFLFQAKGEAQASDLVDIQGMRMYEGWGARLIFQHVIELTTAKVTDAVHRAEKVAAAADAPEPRRRWLALQQRLEFLNCVLASASNMVCYQAQLDRVKARGAAPDPNPVLGTQGAWDRTDLETLARNEIDNAVRMRKLLAIAAEPLLDLAPTPQEESILRLGPALPAQLQRKIEIMNAHWEDYGRLFTEPNP